MGGLLYRVRITCADLNNFRETRCDGTAIRGEDYLLFLVDYPQNILSCVGVPFDSDPENISMINMAWLGRSLGEGAFTIAACLPKHGQWSLLRCASAKRAFSSAVAQETEPREAMEYDVCIVGAGPAGLSAAIKLKQVRGCTTQ